LSLSIFDEVASLTVRASHIFPASLH